MALTKESMADHIEAARSGVAKDDLRAHLEALCQGIIDELTTNGVVTTEVTSGSSAGTYEGDIS